MKKISDQEAWLSWDELNKLAAPRRIVFFGRGDWMDKTMNYLVKEGDYIVDNNKYEQGQVERGMTIYSPEKLRGENPEEIIVIICTSAFIEVEEQLIGYGLVPGRHFVVSPSLKNFRAISRFAEHRGFFYVSSSDQNLPEENERGGGIYRYEIHTGEMKKLVNGLCHAMTQAQDNIYVVDDMAGVLLMDKEYYLLEQYELPKKSRPHGICYDEKRDLIFISYSGRDSIGIYEREGFKLAEEVFWSDKWLRCGTAQHHLNDLTVFNDSLFLSMFSFSGN